MVRSKALRLAAWLLCFALSIFLLFVIPKSYTPSIWVALIFDVIAFVSQLILWIIILDQASDSKGVFNRYPIMAVSTSYLIAELIVCIVTSVLGASLSLKTSLIVNFLIMVVAWVVIVLLISSKNHIERLDSRQKDRHIEL